MKRTRVVPPPPAAQKPTRDPRQEIINRLVCRRGTFTSIRGVRGRIEEHGLYCQDKRSFVPWSNMALEDLQEVVRENEKHIEDVGPMIEITPAMSRDVLAKLKKIPKDPQLPPSRPEPSLAEVRGLQPGLDRPATVEIWDDSGDRVIPAEDFGEDVPF